MSESRISLWRNGFQEKRQLTTAEASESAGKSLCSESQTRCAGFGEVESIFRSAFGPGRLLALVHDGQHAGVACPLECLAVSEEERLDLRSEERRVGKECRS